MNRLRTLSFKLYGEPPAKGSPRSSMLRWIRGVHLKVLPFGLVAYAMLIVWAQTWALVIAGVGLLISIESAVSLSVRIRREERREQG